MSKVLRLSNAIEEISLTAGNSIAYRRIMGVDKKNRERVNVCIEKELLALLREGRRGSISDAVNVGLNLVLVQRGML